MRRAAAAELSGDVEGAKRLIDEALEASTAVHGERHPTTLSTLDNHAIVLMRLGARGGEKSGRTTQAYREQFLLLKPPFARALERLD